MILVLDTCILKLATFPRPDNPAALVVELALRGLVETWASPAMLEEYSDVLGEDPEFLAALLPRMRICFPLTPLAIIRHPPDNRFLECALAVEANFLITVNTARGHFDQPRYEHTRVCTPGVFTSLPEVQPLIRQIIQS